jgi:hypothetical protein
VLGDWFPRAVGVFIGLLMMVLFAGEALALLAVNGHEVSVAGYYVTGALVLAGILVMLPPLRLATLALMSEEAWLNAAETQWGRATLTALMVSTTAFVVIGLMIAAVS